VPASGTSFLFNEGATTVRIEILASLSALLFACSSSNPTVFAPEPDSGASGNDASTARDGGDAGDGFTPIPVRDSGSAGNCSEAAQLAYVLSDSNELYSFRPNRREFTRIGRLRCPTSAQPNSMAIDRDAVAWVNYVTNDIFDSAGAIYRVSTADASCTSAAPIPLPNGWFRLGMGFSTASADDVSETLFVTATGDALTGASVGLGRIDPRALTGMPIGPFTGALRGQNAELTGTGDGRLYGFFTTTPVQVAQIDKTSGAILDTRPLPGVETPQAWAFSFWGGDFYLYTAPSASTGRGTNVTRYRPSDGSIDVAYMRDIGFRVVGAGVSTCAPIAPPP
jgi:hypothetical protein